MLLPRLGPIAAARPPTAPHRLTATVRFSFGKASRMIDSEAGVSSAAPRAWITRATISQATLSAMPQAAEAARNSVTPARKTRFLPWASARPPAGISMVA